MLEIYAEQKANKKLASKLAEEADVDYTNPEVEDDEYMVEDEEYIGTGRSTTHNRVKRRRGRPRKTQVNVQNPAVNVQPINQIITSDDPPEDDSMDEEEPLVFNDQVELLETGSLANGDIPEKIEGLVKRGKKLDAVI